MDWKRSVNTEARIEERRGAIRHAAAGQVRLWVDGQPIEGRLLDCSETGFRVASASGELATGVDVDFVIGSRTGRARVVWNRFTSKHWESGLLIL